MKDTVFMITELSSENGYSLGHRIFLLANDEKFCKNFSNILNNKKIRWTHTYVKEVDYA